MYQFDSTRLVVLNGNYHQMGRQYGLLLCDDLMKMRDLMKAQLITTDIMTYDELKSAVGEPFYQAKPCRQKELLRGVQEATGIDLMDLAIMDDPGRRSICGSSSSTHDTGHDKQRRNGTQRRSTR